uniref:Poly [ADP-ribose] polymerase n=1 Tax=Panagrolaimus sp. JU765 TaxID=591449 RepID=A0AC34R2V0_9BILA
MASGLSKEPPYGTDYAKSDESTCGSCKKFIMQGVLCMSFRVRSEHFDGIQDNWYHFDCFWKQVKVKNLSEGNIKNLEQIKWKDQELIQTKIAEIKDLKDEDNDGIGRQEIDAPTVIVSKSNENCFKCNERIEKHEVSIQYIILFYHPQCFKKLNMFNIPSDYFKGFDDLDREQRKTLIDLFGISKKRKSDSTDDGTPKKKAKFGIDDDLKRKLKRQSMILGEMENYIEENLDSQEIEKIIKKNKRFFRKRDNQESIRKQLADFIIFGVPEQCPKCEKNTLFYNSGSHCYECIGYITEYTRCTYKNKNPARKEIIFPAFIAKKNEYLKYREFTTLEKRYYYPEAIIHVEEEDIYIIHDSAKSPIIKNGFSIDSNCEVAKFSHVFVEKTSGGENIWQATLVLTSISEDRNSCYKLQLLEHDKKKEYYLFCSWGRIGSEGGNKTEYFDSDLERAKTNFRSLFAEKTGNLWANVHNFRKVAGKFHLLNTEFDGKKVPSIDLVNTTSKLPKSIQKLIAMIFDLKAMNQTLKALNLDTEKMPLGMLSAAHIKSAYSILKEAEKLIKEKATESEILDASNRFYYQIPHVSGSSKLPLLDNMRIIEEKTKMLGELMDLEISYQVVNFDDFDMDEEDPIDLKYQQLNCQINVLDQTSKEYEMIENYLKKTHGPTHSNFKLEICDVFEVKREEEHKKFKKEIGNINLLWHGSRTKNFAEILKQGLRIAPPEAPANGYMFGKGVYFADMVSKSANYCHIDANTEKKEGLLLLCDVALGEIQEERKANGNIRKPNNGKSSVKGLGVIVPDEREHKVLNDGVCVPMGKPKKASNLPGGLFYNEFIVYDVAQIKMRYLVKVKFV